MTEEKQPAPSEASIDELVDRWWRAERELSRALERTGAQVLPPRLLQGLGARDQPVTREFVDFALKNLRLELEAFVERKLRQQMLWFFVTAGGMLTAAVTIFGFLVRDL